ncbi:MAG TPA: DUF2723 domain-containing protein, partial [Acidobacteriota bacterium]|nr:DUF2723 domain-containing protein [Acidobacteriota bacterium]
MLTEQVPEKKRHYLVAFIVLAVLALTMYWLTAPRTITWWEGSSWSMAAATLGVAFPPGSLLLTLLGWLFLKLPLGLSTAFQLNLVGGMIAVAMLGVLLRASFDGARVLWQERIVDGDASPGILFSFAISSAVLTLALSWTTWRYANKFTPYILTGLMTAILVWVMLRWWQKAGEGDGLPLLALLLFLFGLDFSVHRTNLLLLPAFFAWVALRRPRILTRWRNWLAGAASLVMGLSAHLFLIPLAGSAPVLNAGDPSTLARFYDYISLKQFGGGWLVNLYPRKGPFFAHQVADYVNAFVANFAAVSGPLGLLGALPCVFGLVGLVVLYRVRTRLALGLTAAFLMTSLGAVVYFNLPAGFPWPMDRHYLPSFIVFSVFVAIGAAEAARLVCRSRSLVRNTLVVTATIAVLAMPVTQARHNFPRVNQSGDRFAHDFAQNVFNTIDEDAILIVQGDNLWPFWYLQAVENVRPDVTLLSLSLLNTTWYVRQVAGRSPGMPASFTDAELAEIGPSEWRGDTVISIAVSEAARANLSRAGIIAPDTVHLRAPTPIVARYVMGQDWILSRMIVENAWRRPFYFT